MIRRRAMIGSGGSWLASLPAWAQPPRAPRRIGVLTVANESSFASAMQALRDGLRKSGYVEGVDIVFEVRHALGVVRDLPRLAAELAALGPAVIVAPGALAANAALAVAADVPVLSVGDMVQAGQAAHLARPGGRTTGVSIMLLQLNVKRLQLLAEVLPRGSAVLNLADLRAREGPMQAVEDAGKLLGLGMHAAYARTATEIDAAFATARKLRVAGVNLLNSPFLSSQHARIIQHAAHARLPAIYQWPEAARDGGLLGYGPSLDALFRQLAGFAARILSGAVAADLPIEQPTRIELAVNLQTARAIGLTIPASLLLRADEVIE